MADLKTYLGLYVKGDAAHKVDDLEKGFDRLAKRGATHMGALSRSMGLAGQGLDKLANRYTALLSGAVGAGAVKYVGDLQERMNYMGITAGKSAQDMDALKQKIFQTAQMSDVRMDPGALLDYVDVIVEKTGDLDFAMANLENAGRAMRATGADGQSMGAWVAQLGEKFNIRTPEGVLAAIDHSINAGKAGAFAFKDLAAQGERLTAAYGAMGRTGPEAGAELDALIQMIRKGTGSSEQAATAFEALMRTFSDAKKLKELKAVGIKVMADDGNMRSGVELYKELIEKSKGDAVKLSTIFDAEAMRAFNAGIAEFKNSGGLKSLDDFMNVAADGTTVKADALRANAGNINASMTALTTAGKQFADVNLAGPVGELADAIGKLKPEQVQSTMKALAWGAGALGAAIAVKKGVDAVRWTAQTLSYVRGGKGGGLAGAAAGIAGGAGGGQAMPVIVMNWPGGGLSGGGLADLAGDGKGTKTTGGKGAKGLIGRLAGRGAGLLGGLARHAGPLAAVGLGAYEGINAMMAGDTRSAVGAIGKAVGGGLGGVAGGALGTMVMPGVGTAVGGFAGATAGATGGEALLTNLYDWLSGVEEKQAQPTKVEGQLALQLQFPPGFSATLQSAQTTSGLDVDLGMTF